MWILLKASLLDWIRLNHSFWNINLLDQNVLMTIYPETCLLQWIWINKTVVSKWIKLNQNLWNISLDWFLDPNNFKWGFYKKVPNWSKSNLNQKFWNASFCHYICKCGLYKKTYLKKWKEVNKEFLGYWFLSIWFCDNFKTGHYKNIFLLKKIKLNKISNCQSWEIFWSTSFQMWIL